MIESTRLELIHFTNYFDVKTNQYGQSHSILFERNIFFYKNRILSRQQLAKVRFSFFLSNIYLNIFFVQFFRQFRLLSFN